MKRILHIISFSIIAMLLTGRIASGQEENVEKKVEKRIKIVTVDKDGNKVELDTTITDDTDLSEIYPEFFKENNVHILRKGDGENFSILKADLSDEDDLHEIFVTVDKKNIYTKDGNIILRSKSSKGENYIFTVDEKSAGNKIWISEDEDLEDGKVHIIIRSKGEIEEMVIDGDAIITIKDGKVTMEGDKAKLQSNRVKGEKKVLQEVEEKKVVKKKKK